MRNMKIFTIGVMILTYMACFGDVSFSQVLGNSVSYGMKLGQTSHRGSSKMGRFNRYSTGLEQIIQPIKRSGQDPLSVRTKVSMRSPISASVGIGGAARPRTRPTNTGILIPTRPNVYNQLLGSKPTMLSLGNMPRGRIFKVERSIGRLRPLRSNTTTFTMKPQGLLRPDLQQRNSVGLGLLRSSPSMVQQRTITRQSPLTRNLLTTQKAKLSRYPTIFEIGRQLQNQRQAPMSIFNVR